jgi:hypothetical protein
MVGINSGAIATELARERCLAARKMVAEGKSPAQEKQREKRRLSAASDFGEAGKRWFKDAKMAESTRSMRKAIFDRDILPVWKSRLLTEITSDDLRALCAKVKERGAPATAIHVRDIVKQIYGYAVLHPRRSPTPPMTSGRLPSPRLHRRIVRSAQARSGPC